MVRFDYGLMSTRAEVSILMQSEANQVKITRVCIDSGKFL